MPTVTRAFGESVAIRLFVLYFLTLTDLVIHTLTYSYVKYLHTSLSIAHRFFNDRLFIINLELIFFSQKCLDTNDVGIGFHGNWRIEYFYLLGEIPHVVLLIRSLEF